MSTDTIDHSARDHALLSASGASRWINCPPSPRLESKFEEKSSVYGEEGTLAHEFAELNLKLQLKMITKANYNKLVKPFKADPLYSPEMEEYVQIHVDYVKQQWTEAQVRTKDAVIMIEQKVDFSEFVKEGYGTGDNIIVADDIIDVIDFKYGQGVVVSAEDNPQMKLYALGALAECDMMFDIKTVRMTIVQPRRDNISTAEMSVEDLVKWANEVVKPKAVLAYDGKGTMKAGSWCKFCKAAPRCKTLYQKTLDMAKDDFADPELMDDNELIEAYKNFPVINGYMTKVAQYLLEEAIGGKEWPEHKLVTGKSNRAWTNKDEAAILLKKKKFPKKDYMSEPKLLGITAIEKLVGKGIFFNMFSTCMGKPLGKPTLVHESDKRPPYVLAAAKDDFKDQTE